MKSDSDKESASGVESGKVKSEEEVIWPKAEPAAQVDMVEGSMQTDVPDFMAFAGAKSKEDMEIHELTGLVPLKLPNDAWRDHKKLTKFLGEVEKTMNRQIIGMQKMMDIFSKNIIARPTYHETYFNFRLNVQDVQVPMQE
jgi:hypothetical protein